MRWILLSAPLLLAAATAGCISPTATGPAGLLPTQAILDAVETGACVAGTGGPQPPPGEEVVGLRPVEMVFGGSLRHPVTRVLLVPPAHGDLGLPTNASRSATAYLEATLEGIFAWEPAIREFTMEHPQFSYLRNVSVQVELFEGQAPATAGYDILIGYTETSGPVFRGIAADPTVANPALDPQGPVDAAGLGNLAHAAHRFVLLSLFAYSERAGQQVPDFPETPEVRGVTMHEFAHVWGLGHSATFTPGCGPDLMNSPYTAVYGDGDPAGDGGERSRPMCISSLDLYGLAHLYRWLPKGPWEGSAGHIELPRDLQYKEYCGVHAEAAAQARAFLESVR